MNTKSNDTLSKTLGPVSSKLIHELLSQNKSIFTLQEASDIYGKPKLETSFLIRDLVNRGVVTRIKPGLFLVFQSGLDNAPLDNWPVIAHILSGKCEYYISHYSAMRLHGMTTHPLLDVFITVTKRKQAKNIHNLKYHFIYIKKEHFGDTVEHWVTKQQKVKLSSLERTILDGLDRPELCGGLKEVIRGIWSKQKQIDWNKLIKCVNQYHSKAAIKRLGFILQTINVGTEYLPFLKEILIDKNDYILLDPNGLKAGHFLSEWKIQVNLPSDEILAGVWA